MIEIIGTIMRTLLVTFLFIPIFSIFAYQPGKWSHLDECIIAKCSNGPTGLKVFDPQKNLIQSAEYYYSSDGKLMEERFYGPKGEFQGKNIYSYTLDLPREEILYDAANKVLSRRSYTFKNRELVTLEAFDEKNSPIIRQEYQRKSDSLIAGIEISPTDKDHFEITLVGKKITRVLFRDSDGSAISDVVYNYDKSGMLQSRMRDLGGSISICLYKYDARGLLESYSFFIEDETGRALEKELVLIYR